MAIKEKTDGSFIECALGILVGAVSFDIVITVFVWIVMSLNSPDGPTLLNCFLVQTKFLSRFHLW